MRSYFKGIPSFGLSQLRLFRPHGIDLPEIPLMEIQSDRDFLCWHYLNGNLTVKAFVGLLDLKLDESDASEEPLFPIIQNILEHTLTPDQFHSLSAIGFSPNSTLSELSGMLNTDEFMQPQNRSQTELDEFIQLISAISGDYVAHRTRLTALKTYCDKWQFPQITHDNQYRPTKLA